MTNQEWEIFKNGYGAMRVENANEQFDLSSIDTDTLKNMQSEHEMRTVIMETEEDQMMYNNIERDIQNELNMRESN
mgnify:FL=1